MENKLIAKANTSTARRAAALIASGLYWTATESHFESLPKEAQSSVLFNINKFEKEVTRYFSKGIALNGSAKLSIENDQPDQNLMSLINSTGINASHLPKDMAVWASDNAICVSLSPKHTEMVFPEYESVFC